MQTVWNKETAGRCSETVFPKATVTLESLRSFAVGLYRLYLMHVRRLILAAVYAILTGLAVAVAMTFWDWRSNPASIFHNESGTDWTVVAETALSWFAPVALAVFVLIVIAAYFVVWIRRG